MALSLGPAGTPSARARAAETASADADATPALDATPGPFVGVVRLVDVVRLSTGAGVLVGGDSDSDWRRGDEAATAAARARLAAVPWRRRDDAGVLTEVLRDGVAEAAGERVFGVCTGGDAWRDVEADARLDGGELIRGRVLARLDAVGLTGLTDTRELVLVRLPRDAPVPCARSGDMACCGPRPLAVELAVERPVCDGLIAAATGVGGNGVALACGVCGVAAVLGFPFAAVSVESDERRALCCCGAGLGLSLSVGVGGTLTITGGVIGRRAGLFFSLSTGLVFSAPSSWTMIALDEFLPLATASSAALGTFGATGANGVGAREDVAPAAAAAAAAATALPMAPMGTMGMLPSAAMPGRGTTTSWLSRRAGRDVRRPAARASRSAAVWKRETRDATCRWCQRVSEASGSCSMRRARSEV